MNYLIDTHCHLHDREFFDEKQAEKMLKSAHERGVAQIICIGTSHRDSLEAKNFAEKYPNVFWTYGEHPEAANSLTGNSINGSLIRDILRDKNVQSLVAIGEVGLDYHYPNYNREAQIRLLEEMLQLAIDNNLPCSFHVREALSDFFAIVKNFSGLKPSVLHSFSDSSENLDYALKNGFYIGINGIATFANLECYRNLTTDFIERCVIETDAPFLTPVPNRGKINEPGNVRDVAAWLAEKCKISEAQVAEWTTKNARVIFNLPNPESTANAASGA